MNEPNRPWLWLGLVALCVIVALVIVGVVVFVASAPTGKPIIVINAPAPGAQFGEGQAVVVQSTATDAKGIVRVVLSVDNVVVQEDKLDAPQTALQRQQTWQATGVGAHRLIVRAFRADGTANEPVSVTVNVVPGGTPAPTPTPLASCYNAAAMVSDDITVPDGAAMPPGQRFTKVWRMLNNGTCSWGAGYQLALVGGEAMSNVNVVSAPNTLPGAMADVSVPMTAPTAPGLHVGHWRLRGSDGQPFGSLLDVRINVPNPQPPPTCTGKPQISSFTASPTTIAPHSLVSLNWSLMNVSAAQINPGIGAIATSGSIQIVVDNSTTFVLTAYCGSATDTRQVLVNVVSPTVPPTPVPPTPKPAFQVTGASMNVSPSNYVGFCPGHFYYTGSITTNDAGQVTLRWIGAGSAPSPMMTFYAPGPGAHALPGYSQEWGTKGSLWAQLVIVTPNQLSSNQAAFTNSCSDPTPIPPPTNTPPPPPPTNTPVPPPPTNTPLPPPPTNTPVPPRPNINGAWRAPNQFLIEDLAEALGCMNYPCHVSGKFMDIRGTPLDGSLAGSFDGARLTFDVAWNMPGAPALSFNGTFSGNSISGSWRMGGDTGSVTFVR